MWKKATVEALVTSEWNALLSFHSKRFSPTFRVYIWEWENQSVQVARVTWSLLLKYSHQGSCAFQRGLSNI